MICHFCKNNLSINVYCNKCPKSCSYLYTTLGYRIITNKYIVDLININNNPIFDFSPLNIFKVISLPNNFNINHFSTYQDVDQYLDAFILFS